MHFLLYLTAIASCVGVFASPREVQASFGGVLPEPLIDSAGNLVTTGVRYNLACTAGVVKVSRYGDDWDYFNLGPGDPFSFELCSNNGCKGKEALNVAQSVYFKIPGLHDAGRTRLGFLVKPDHWWLTSRNAGFAQAFFFENVSGEYVIRSSLDPRYVIALSPGEYSLEMRSPGKGQLLCKLQRD
ncbi:hypothetical protein KVV02_000728 [Mortierella alpina]|uniref:Uncharacterized protein n=1 Tax=Mortierella alpina TaxID=64518 RepID=A0A9P8CU70_MORAP|nr:hypothetical protein KVV02_000728 [Mortierella alpina]